MRLAAFGDRRFADAGLANVQRIVLAAAAQHLDGALHFVGATDQRVDLAVARELVEVHRELGQGVALAFALAAFARLRFAVFLRGARGFLAAVLGDAMRDVIDHVQAGDVLLVEEVDRVAVLLAEDRHQHVRAGDLLLAAGLHVVDRALQHSLEAQRGLRVAVDVLGQHRHRGGDGLLQVGAQALEIHAACLEHGFGRWVVEQRQQQVFDRHVLVTRLAGALVALADAVFEILAEHGGVSLRKATAVLDGDAHGEFHARQASGSGVDPAGSALIAQDVLSRTFRPFPSCTARDVG